MDSTITPTATPVGDEHDGARAAGAHEDQDTLNCELRRLRDLVDNGRVDEARVLIKEMEQRWPESAPVQHFARVLAPPKVLPPSGRPNRSFEREHAWLRQHAREYPGQWLAVLGGRLVAADRELSRVLELLRQTPNGNRALLHRQFGSPE